MDTLRSTTAIIVLVVYQNQNLNIGISQTKVKREWEPTKEISLGIFVAPI